MLLNGMRGLKNLEIRYNDRMPHFRDNVIVGYLDTGVLMSLINSPRGGWQPSI